jgi:hypothetical protein
MGPISKNQYPDHFHFNPLLFGNLGLIRAFHVRRLGAEIGSVRHVEIGEVYVPASWLTGLTVSQGVDVGKL